MSLLADINRLAPADLEARWEEVLNQLIVSLFLLSSVERFCVQYSCHLIT